jgi:hypothetical protein
VNSTLAEALPKLVTAMDSDGVFTAKTTSEREQWAPADFTRRGTAKKITWAEEVNSRSVTSDAVPYGVRGRKRRLPDDYAYYYAYRGLDEDFSSPMVSPVSSSSVEDLSLAPTSRLVMLVQKPEFSDEFILRVLTNWCGKDVDFCQVSGQSIATLKVIADAKRMELLDKVVSSKVCRLDMQCSEQTVGEMLIVELLKGDYHEQALKLVLTQSELVSSELRIKMLERVFQSYLSGEIDIQLMKRFVGEFKQYQAEYEWICTQCAKLSDFVWL